MLRRGSRSGFCREASQWRTSEPDLAPKGARDTSMWKGRGRARSGEAGGPMLHVVQGCGSDPVRVAFLLAHFCLPKPFPAT